MPWTMIAASIGAQLFNSWQANKKTEELQARQREFQRAAQQKDFDRIRQLQRETAQLALEIEADVHKQRLEDIEANYDDIVKQYSTEIAIKKWPLKVLPFVMRGESFGTFFNGTKSIALHVILTPSNCDRFNEAVYTDIDLQLEAACNQHWNTQSFHPIAYYGGAWRKSSLDLDHVDLLKTQLKNVPTIVITPYFSPNLYFKVQMWGMGKDTEIKIELPHDLFSYDYEKDMNYSPKDESPKGDLIDTTIEEFVPYLKCLIGYIADHYYYSMYNIAPRLYICHNSISANKVCLPFSLKDEIHSWFQTVYNKRLGYSTKTKMNEIGDCAKYNLFEWDDLSTLLELKSIIEKGEYENELYEEYTIVKNAINDLLKQNTLNPECLIEQYNYLSLDELYQNILSLETPYKDSSTILYLEFSIKDRIVSIYYDSSRVVIDGVDYYHRYNYKIDCLLVPAELSRKKIKRIKLSTKDIDSYINSLKGECGNNFFYRELTLNEIIAFCNSLHKKIKKCELIRGQELGTVINDVTYWKEQHLLYCNIECHDENYVQMFYYDSLDIELSRMFEDATNLILE